MFPTQGLAIRNAFVEDVVGTTATDVAVDCLGYDYATIIVTTGTLTADLTALDIHFTPLSNTSLVAGNLVFSAAGATGATRLPQDDDDDATFVYHLNLAEAKAASGAALVGGERYLQFVVTAGATANEIACTVLLSRGSPIPSGAQEVTGDATNVVHYIN